MFIVFITLGIYIVFVLKAFGTLVKIFQFIFNALYVPLLCSPVLLVNIMHFLKYITLVPLLDFLSLMQLPCVFVPAECWTCK